MILYTHNNLSDIFFYYKYYTYSVELGVCIIIVIIIIVIIIPSYSRVRQISWTSVFLGPCSSNPLRGLRNLRAIFAGCVLFLLVLLFGVDSVRSCQALFRFSDVLRYLWVLFPGLRSPPALLLPSFPKVFLLRFLGLGT